SHLSAKKWGIRDVDWHVESIQVPVLALPSLLKKHSIREVSLLQIDTEGFDCRIVESALRCGLRPMIINYEFIHTDPSERARCKRMLMENDYRFIDVGRDTLAVRHA